MPNRTYIIAEIGQAHDGSLGMVHAYIDAVAQTGVDAIKFQTHIAEAESSLAEPFRVKFSYQDATRFDYWKRMSFSPEQWEGIKSHCEAVGLQFLSSPFSLAAVDLLDSIGMERYKIGSGEVSNFLMLEKIARTGKPVILSSGMSSFDELDQSVAFIQSRGNELSIMQCTTSYPTPPEKVGLNVITEMRQRYPNIPIGLSDHSGTLYASLAAVTLGAELLEFHVVFDRRMFGPDTASSLTIDETQKLVEGVKHIETMLAHPVDKHSHEEYHALKNMFEKSLAVNKDLPAGHVLSFDDLESKKPANQGISAKAYESVIGKMLKKPMAAYAFLTEEDIV